MSLTRRTTLSRTLLSSLFPAASLLGFGASAQDKFIVMASTTSTEQSGLFAHLLPAFEHHGDRIGASLAGRRESPAAGRRVILHDQAAEGSSSPRAST